MSAFKKKVSSLLRPLRSIGAVPEGLITSHTTQEERAKMPMARNGKALYAICYEWWPAKGYPLTADIMYCLATDEGDARFQYMHAPLPKTSAGARIVALAPAIGYHVIDDHGEKLAPL